MSTEPKITTPKNLRDLQAFLLACLEDGVEPVGSFIITHLESDEPLAPEAMQQLAAELAGAARVGYQHRAVWAGDDLKPDDVLWGNVQMQGYAQCAYKLARMLMGTDERQPHHDVSGMLASRARHAREGKAHEPASMVLHHMIEHDRAWVMAEYLGFNPVQVMREQREALATEYCGKPVTEH